MLASPAPPSLVRLRWIALGVMLVAGLSSDARATRYGVGGRGFITQFDTIGPLPARKFRRVWPDRGGPRFAAAEAWTHLGKPGPVMAFGTSRKARGWVLQGTLHAARAERVHMRFGFTGEVTIRVGGEQVFRGTDIDALLIDDYSLPLDLKPGANRVAIRLKSVARLPLQWVLRFRDSGERTPTGITWETTTTATSGCDAHNMRLDRRLGADGWTRTLHVSAAQLQPLQGRGDPWLEGKSRQGAWVRSAATKGPTQGDRRVLLEPGEAPFETLRWGMGEEVCGQRTASSRPTLEGRFLRLRQQCLTPTEDRSVGDQSSLSHDVSRLHAGLVAGDSEAYLNQELSTLETICAPGKGSYDKATGVIHRAYTSPLDGRAQPYTMFVPPSYAVQTTRSYPLIVVFHGLGYSPEEALHIACGQPTQPGALTAGKRRAPTLLKGPDALMVSVNAYGSVGHRTLGEQDVLQTLREVRSRYRVDASRVSITGFSLGGTSAFVLPLHFPSLFAAAAPICGYPDVGAFGAVKHTRKTPWERVLLAQKSIEEYAANGKDIPLFVFHGGRDRPERSEPMVEAYRRLKQRVFYAPERTSKMGHNVWDYAYKGGALLRRLIRWKRPVRPRMVRFRTLHLRYNQAHWVQLDAQVLSQSASEIVARERGKVTRVRTKNVRRMTLQLRPGTTELRVDGTTLQMGDRDLDTVRLARHEGTWRWATEGDAAKEKRAGQSGPLDDVWYGRLIIVVGTQDPLQTEANRLVGEALRRYNRRSDVSVAVVKDRDVTEAMLRGTHVMLIGQPNSNSVTLRAAAQIPAKFDATSLTLGGRRWEGEDVGVSMILPSPFDPNHYLVLHAGVGRTGTLSARNLPEWVPDYLVYDKRIRQQWGAKLLDRRKVLMGGFFDNHWNI